MNSPVAGTRVHTALRLSALFALALLAHASSASAQNAPGIRGLARDAATGRPIVGAVIMLAGTSYSSLTSPTGAFALTGVRPGTYTLRLSHVAYGEKTIQVEVGADGESEVMLTVSQTAIELQPISVQAQSASDDRQRRLGVRDGRVTREEIARLESLTATLADVLQRHIPTVRVRRTEALVGSQICIELRTIRVSGVQPTCLSPAVYLDGVPISNPTMLYSTLSLETIESLEVVPAAESGVRYGTGALYGALLIETRRPGRTPASRPVIAAPTKGFDWSLDAGTHPQTRAYVFSFVGNAIGLSAGLSAARQCIRLRQPAEDAIVTDCNTFPTIAAAVAGIALPALGAGLGSRLGGRTSSSQGRLLPAAAGAAMALLPGYALALTSQRGNSDAMGAASLAVLTLGVPLATTIADRLFRSIRD